MKFCKYCGRRLEDGELCSSHARAAAETRASSAAAARQLG